MRDGDCQRSKNQRNQHWLNTPDWALRAAKAAGFSGKNLMGIFLSSKSYVAIRTESFDESVFIKKRYASCFGQLNDSGISRSQRS
jgi:hypothetical protein